MRLTKGEQRNVNMKPDDPRHGTMTGYVSGKCRCPLCKAAAKAYRKEYRQRHLESIRLAEKAYRKQRASIIANAHKVCQAKKLEELQANSEDARHGTISAYNAGCRCARCIEAGRKQRERWKAKNKQELEANKDDPRHGTSTGYVIGCRCFRCRQAESIRRKRSR